MEEVQSSAGEFWISFLAWTFPQSVGWGCAPRTVKRRACSHHTFEQGGLAQLSSKRSEQERTGEREGTGTRGRRLLSTTNENQKKGREPLPPVHIYFQLKREFDMRQYGKRYIALKLAYIGWDYHGLATQENIENTIEVRWWPDWFSLITLCRDIWCVPSRWRIS